MNLNEISYFFMEERGSLDEKIPIDRGNSSCMLINGTKGHFRVEIRVELSIFDGMKSLIASMKNSKYLNYYLF